MNKHHQYTSLQFDAAGTQKSAYLSHTLTKSVFYGDYVLEHFHAR